MREDFQNLRGSMCFMQTKQKKCVKKRDLIRFSGEVLDNDYFGYYIGLSHKILNKLSAF